MKNCLYILKNPITHRYYIGSTNNLNRRLNEHLSGKTRTTRILKTYNLVYVEEFDTIQEARFRERSIKSYKSKNYIEELIFKNMVAVAQR